MEQEYKQEPGKAVNDGTAPAPTNDVGGTGVILTASAYGMLRGRARRTGSRIGKAGRRRTICSTTAMTE
ncbi:hypothetical protein ACFTAO_01750 [Paenibacillus rhizoplanae]